MMSVGLVYLLAPEPLVSLFRSSAGDSEALIAVGATMLMLSALWQLADAANLVLSEALRAAGDTTYCMVARLVLGWLVFTPVAWAAVLVFDAGIGLMMTTMIVYLFAQAGVFALRFASGRWREIDMVGEPELV
jgi:MATE family multidrug resistance protein